MHKLSIGKRRIERQVAFNIWLKNIDTNKNLNSYQLNIVPIVMMNYRRQDDVWKLDLDANQVANPICKDLADLIFKMLN